MAPTSFGENFINSQSATSSASLSQPPSYAAAVKGPGSVPSFITHGPHSMPPAPLEGVFNKMNSVVRVKCVCVCVRPATVSFCVIQAKW